MVKTKKTTNEEALPHPTTPSIDLEKAKREANRIIEKAKEEARIIKEQIQQEKEAFHEKLYQLKEKVKEEGYKEGLRLGREDGYQQIKQQIQVATEVADLAKMEYFNQVEQSEETILEIAIKIAEKILDQRLSEQPESFLPIVKKAIQEVKEYKEVRVFVHYKMYPLILQKKDEWRSLYFHNSQLIIYPSDELSETSCIIETDGGRIDASVDSQLEELRDKLFKIFHGDPK